MHIVVVGVGGETHELDIDAEVPLMILKAMAADAVGLGVDGLILQKDGKELNGDEKTLAELKIANNDVLQATSVQLQSMFAGFGNITVPNAAQRQQQQHSSTSSNNSNSNPFAALAQQYQQQYQQQQPSYRQKAEQLIQHMTSDPYSLSALKQNNPELAEAIGNMDVDFVEKTLREVDQAKKKREDEMRDLQRRLHENPFDVDAQRKIEEQIQLENVEQQRQHAMEHMPEAFGSVVMLYIDIVVNGVPLKAFVDSGAQMTIMSNKCAERCGLMRLIDRRFQGMAVGVGQQKIVGRVHMADLIIGGDHLPVSFSVLENQPMDVLLGLDMLKRHRCKIDLENNCLTIGTTGNSTPFLSEADIPHSVRLSRQASGLGTDVDGDVSKTSSAQKPLSSTTQPTQGQSSSSSSSSAMKSESTASASEPSEEAIMLLMELGSYTYDQVRQALIVCNGNSDLAAQYLMKNS